MHRHELCGSKKDIGMDLGREGSCAYLCLSLLFVNIRNEEGRLAVAPALALVGTTRPCPVTAQHLAQRQNIKRSFISQSSHPVFKSDCSCL